MNKGTWQSILHGVAKRVGHDQATNTFTFMHINGPALYKGIAVTISDNHSNVFK